MSLLPKLLLHHSRTNSRRFSLCAMSSWLTRSFDEVTVGKYSVRRPGSARFFSNVKYFPLSTYYTLTTDGAGGGGNHAHIDKSKSVSEVLAEWHEQRQTFTPDVTLTSLIEVTNLIRLSKDYKSLSSPIFKQLLQTSVDSASSLEPEQVVTLLWVLAKIRWSNYIAVKKLVTVLRTRLSDLSDKAIGLVPWALVTLKVARTYKPFMNRIVKEVASRLENGTMQDSRALANVCWSLSTARYWPRYFTPHVERFLKNHKLEISPHTLSVFLHAMSKAGVLNSEDWLFNIINDKVNQFKDADSQSLILILWSIGNQKRYNSQFFDTLGKEVLSGGLVKQYTPRVVATLIWCCARTQYYHPDLLKHLTEHVPNYIDDMTLQDLGMVAYSLGFLNYSCPDLLKAITDSVMSKHSVKLDSFQVLLNLSWACLINQVYPSRLFEACMSEQIIGSVDTNTRPRPLNHVHQLLQLDLASRYEQPQKDLPRLSPHDKLQMLIEAATSAVKEKSKFQKNVADILVDMYGCVHYLNMETFSSTGYGLDFELLLDGDGNPVSVPHSSTHEEYSINAVRETHAKMIEEASSELCEGLDFTKLRIDGGKNYNLSVDWFARTCQAERRVAIEVDGPAHFAANCHHPLGRTALKSRQLSAVGWEVVSIPYYEWWEFGVDERDAMQAYLKNKLLPLTN